MYSFSRLAVVLSIIFSLSAPSPGFSYGQGDGEGEGRTSGGVGGAGLSNATTRTVVRALTRGVARCQRVERVYRFDCYRQTYQLAASLLNGRPAYRDARKALESVEAALDKVMKRHVDPNVARKRQGLQTYSAIKPTAIPRATAEMELALNKAETVLLRAPERTGKHYTRIAEAVDSNKLLLRSRLYPEGNEMFRRAFA
ncbi:MAG: hypothetical protein L3J36_13015 [Rhodobacteraceae bacterium]|nr:hypothetical protein [Paracoccaceae bacterium]